MPDEPDGFRVAVYAVAVVMACVFFTIILSDLMNIVSARH